MRQFYSVLLVLGGIAIGACVAPQLSPQASSADTPATPTKWEYRIYNEGMEPNLDEAEANKLGSDRWEMIGFALQSNNAYRAYIFKRSVAN